MFYKNNCLSNRVYSIVKKIPKGKVSSYGKIAKKVRTSARAVGQILKRNPYSPRVPCHRVVCFDGKIGGFNGSSYKNIKKKINMLRKEGVEFEKGKVKKECFVQLTTGMFKEKN